MKKKHTQELNFRDRVYAIVSQIPEGGVMTYGQIAAICGNPRSARIVGGIAHFGDSELPWHRVVKKDGTMAEGYPGGVTGHKEMLLSEKIEFINNKVIMTKFLWNPQIK